MTDLKNRYLKVEINAAPFNLAVFVLSTTWP